MPTVIAIWGIVSFASAIIAGIVAGAKRRDHSFWAAGASWYRRCCSSFSLTPSNKGPRQRRPGLDEPEQREI